MVAAWFIPVGVQCWPGTDHEFYKPYIVFLSQFQFHGHTFSGQHLPHVYADSWVADTSNGADGWMTLSFEVSSVLFNCYCSYIALFWYMWTFISICSVRFFITFAKTHVFSLVHICNSLYTQVKEGYFQQNVLSSCSHLSCLLPYPTSALSMSLMNWESRGKWKMSRILVTAGGRGEVDAWNIFVGESFSFSDPAVICMYSLSE